MADRNALGMIGLLLCAATLAVMTIGGVVIGSHLSGGLELDDGLRVAASLPIVAAR